MKIGHGEKITLKKSIPSALVFTISNKKHNGKNCILFMKVRLVINLEMCVGMLGWGGVFLTKGER